MMEAPMSKKHIARVARLVRKVAEFLVPVITVIKLIVELVDKAANCNARKLQIQIPGPR
jgi:hypothetical protein